MRDIYTRREYLWQKRWQGHAAADVLQNWDVQHIFGMPGDSINNFVDVLRGKKDDIEFIQIRHEEVAALAASSYAKLTGKIGVCMTIGGPGAIHLLNGLYDAKADGAPVLVLAVRWRQRNSAVIHSRRFIWHACSTTFRSIQRP